MSEFSFSEPIQDAIDLTRQIADALDRRRREPSNIAAAATIATWAIQNDLLVDISEYLTGITELLCDAFGGDCEGDDAEEGDGDDEGDDGEGDDLDSDGGESDGDDETDGDGDPGPVADMSAADEPGPTASSDDTTPSVVITPTAEVVS